MIQGARPYAYKHFAGSRLWVGRIDIFQYFRSAMPTEKDSLHDASGLF
jgi:hypothetical protein